MTQDAMIDSLYAVMRDHLNWPHLQNFHPDARLNEDLYLDSIMILQLILHLELDLGIEVPDDALVASDFATINQLAQALCRVPQTATVAGGTA